MYILNSDQTLPVKNIKFDNIKGFEIHTRYINENKFEFGLFKTSNFLTGWNHPFKITYYINNSIKIDKVEKYTIDIPKNSISSFITTINTGCKLIKSSFKDLNNDYKKTEKAKIPKIIIQTHKNYNFNKKEYYYASRSWILKNPGYKYVFYDSENNATILNLSSGDSANLTLMITTLDNATFQDTKFDLNVKSRTEDVYTSTFHLYNRDKQ